MNNYNIFVIFLLIFFMCSYTKYNENLTKLGNPKKRLIEMDDLIKADNYAYKILCERKGYGYKDGTCTHIKKSTCIKDHPGIIANAEDIELINKLKESPCTQQLDAFKPLKAEVGEWLVAKDDDKKQYIKLKKEYSNLEEEVKKNPSKEINIKLLKLESKLFRAERDGHNRCQYSDQSFKRWCLQNKLQYTPNKDGLGKCEITERFCTSKIMNYDKDTKDCTKKDQTAEWIFGATMVRGIQAGQGSDEVWDCKVSPCYKDEWCAGAGICKPITNPGQSCWHGHHESCWCNSLCKLPFNSGAIDGMLMIIGAAIIVICVVILAAVITVATAGAMGPMAGAGAGMLIAATIGMTVAGMGGGMMGVRGTQLSLEAARCSAGEDGKTIPGGKNGPGSYLENSQVGCAHWYQCPPGKYCPIGNGRCKTSKDPGELCPAGQHSWCKGKSDCIPYVDPIAIGAGILFAGATMGLSLIPTATLGKCSAGKDGIIPVGKKYKWISVKKKRPPPNILFEEKLKKFKEIEDFKDDPDFKQIHGLIRPPNQISWDKKKIVDIDNGNVHYMALGHSGCGAAMPCPPGYYCPFGAGHCKKAKDPGNHCLAGQHSWCKGRSKCLGSSKCSCGKDGINGPGPLYYKDENGNDIKEKGMIYDNGSTHYTCLGSIGCSFDSPTPPGYYCKSIFNTPRKAQMPGNTCLGSQSSWCLGSGSCRVGAVGGGKCTAGEDGINPPGTLLKSHIPDITEEEYTWKGKKYKIKYDKRFIGEDKIINKQVGTGKFIALDEHGCGMATQCPTHVKKGNKTENYHCEVSFKSCKPPIDSGKYCLAGQDHWCKEKRCKGTVCSTKIGDRWHVPIGGRCWSASDSCEPDTWCKSKGFVGECKFGQPTGGWDKFSNAFLK